MADFVVQVKSFNDAVIRDVHKTRRMIFLEIGRRVILRTPVAEHLGGTARGGWQSTIGQAASSDIQRIGSEVSLQELLQAVQGVGGDEILYLTNLVPYINKLEFGGYPNPPKKGKGKTIGGFSTQAPAGMVRITLAEFEAVVKLSVRGTKFKDG